MEKSGSDNKPSLLYLVKTFLVVGASSFGGYSALISVVQDRLVERDKLISNKIIVEGFSLASVLPGPVAVNTVTYIGFSLRGWPGAMASMVSVITPSFFLMIVLTHFYLRYGTIPEVASIMQGILPVVMGIILMAGYNMSKKNLKAAIYFSGIAGHSVLFYRLLLLYTFSGFRRLDGLFALFTKYSGI